MLRSFSLMRSLECVPQLSSMRTKLRASGVIGRGFHSSISIASRPSRGNLSAGLNHETIIQSRLLQLISNGVRSFSTKEVPVPSMGDSISEGAINHWKLKIGDYIEADAVIAVIDTDKVSVDINSPVSGVVTELKANAGDTVLVGSPLFVIDTSAPKPAAASPQAVPPPTKSAPSEKKAPVTPPTTAESASPKTAGKPSTPPSAAPTLNKGSAKTVAGERGEKRVPMSRMRLRIAERLKGAQNTAAMLTTFNECDMGNLMALRTEMNEAFQAKHGVKLGFVSAFMLAAAKSMQKIPEVNAFIDGKDIIYKDYADISVAVATPTGLMVPVVKDCDKKTWADLEKDLGDLAQRARKNQIALEDMAGGTFTISNGGVYGSMLGTPIINPPQSSILGMHGVTKRPVVRGNDIVIRPIMYLALTYDHRLIDGREAVLFLCSIRDYIEEPRKMLLDL